MSDSPPDARSGADHGLTSLHVRRACAGSPESLDWLVLHFTPLLRLQARRRLSGPLRRVYDPDDLVNDVWLAVLPRLAQLDERDGRLAPVFLRFVATTLLNKANHLLEKAARRGEFAPVDEARASASAADEWVAEVLERVARNAASVQLHAALERLDEREREVVVLRGIEQLPNRVVAESLGENESTVAMRYGRALQKLRGVLPPALLDELA